MCSINIHSTIRGNGLIRCLPPGELIKHGYTKFSRNMINVWGLCCHLKKRGASCSSQHSDAIGCSLRTYGKFEINLRLFAIWL